jgi:hypothetical protein
MYQWGNSLVCLRNSRVCTQFQEHIRDLRIACVEEGVTTLAISTIDIAPFFDNETADNICMTRARTLGEPSGG